MLYALAAALMLGALFGPTPEASAHFMLGCFTGFIAAGLIFSISR